MDRRPLRGSRPVVALHETGIFVAKFELLCLALSQLRGNFVGQFQKGGRALRHKG